MGKASSPAAAERIGRLAVRALLREVAAAPKPGLVDRNGCGAHGDMDFMTFADSALALGASFTACAAAGLRRGAAAPHWAGASFPDPEGLGHTAVRPFGDAAFLAELRSIGIAGEARMFAATRGVNTHKGALFLLGLLAAAAGALIGADVAPDAGRTRRLAARLVRGLADRELPAAGTNGARAFREHGSRGVRGEAEAGLPSLDSGALALLRRVRLSRQPADTDCVDALLMIMGVADDTTVLHRGGAEALRLVQSGAAAVLASGGMGTQAGQTRLRRLAADLVARRISPGGSADLLAAAIFLVDIEKYFSSYGSYRSAAPRPCVLTQRVLQ